MTVSPENQHRIVTLTIKRLRWLADDLAAGDGETETVNLLREWARDLEAERGNLIWQRRPHIPTGKD